MASYVRLKCKKYDADYNERSSRACPSCGGAIEIQYDYEAMSKVISRKTLANREPGV